MQVRMFELQELINSKYVDEKIQYVKLQIMNQYF